MGDSDAGLSPSSVGRTGRIERVRGPHLGAPITQRSTALGGFSAAIVVLIGGIAWWSGAAPATSDVAPIEVPAVAPSSNTRPNILVLMWDTTRADRMSLYGHDRQTTPRLDAFSKDALVFDAAISPSFWTLPSHASLFTGLPASVHMANAHSLWLANARLTLAEWLGEHGYRTYLFSVNPNLTAETNLIQGFDVVESHREEPWRTKAVALTDAKLIARDRSSERSPSWLGEPLASSKDAGPVVEEAALQWLNAQDDEKPWFVFLNYMEVHSPRTPSLASRQALLSPEVLELGLQTETGFVAVNAANRGDLSYTDAEREAILGVYDAALRDLDATTGDLLDALDAGGFLENTIVVLTSDHGENFGEHGLYGHNYALTDTLIHVPLVIWAPGVVESGRVKHPVSTRDLFGTLIALAGLELPESPVPLGNVFTQSPDAPVFSELFAFHGSRPTMAIRDVDGEYIPLRQRYRAVIQRGWKFIRSSDGSRALYNRRDDPGEYHNLVDDKPARAAQLQLDEEAWRATLPPMTREERAAEEIRLNQRKPKPVTTAELRALGYVQ